MFAVQNVFHWFVFESNNIFLIHKLKTVFMKDIGFC